MGRTYLFECSKCGYRARVSGSADRGRHVVVQTVLCAECKELYDAVIAFKPSVHWEFHPKTAPGFISLLNRLPPRGVRPWIKWKLVCPISPRHRIRLWKQPDKCPRCGTFLDPSVIPFRRWD
jgi:NAD-dependent SIR2 family protein deacetylase